MDVCHRHKILSLKAGARLARNCIVCDSDASEGDDLRMGGEDACLMKSSESDDHSDSIMHWDHSISDAVYHFSRSI